MVHVAIIGAYGSAGVAAAEELVTARRDDRLPDLQLSLIDDGDPPGGLCILRGCMPSKDVLSAGAHRFQARHDDRLEASITADPDAVVDRKDDHVRSFAKHRRESVETLAEREWVTLHRQRGRLVDSHTIQLDDRDLEVDYVVVATGSTPALPPIPGIDEVEVKTSADVLDMRSFPDRAIVIGLGFIGLELVPYLVEVGGSEVIAIDRNDRPLSDADPAYGDTIVELYRDAFGVELLTGASATAVESTTDGIELTVDVDGTERHVTGDELFGFAGRTPAIDDLGLDTIGVDTDRPIVDATLRTATHSHLFVVGDANSREPILHIAKEEGIVAASNIALAEAEQSPERYEPMVHRIVFTGLGIYPYARLGHTPESAERDGLDPIAVTRAAGDDGVFKTKGVPEGLATLVVDGDDGRVIGYQGLHHHADVFAKTLQVIIETGLRVDEIPDRAYHPTTPELLDGLLHAASEALAAR